MRLNYLRDERQFPNVTWVYAHPTLGEISVVNPRRERDEDGWDLEWDRLLIQGEAATDEQLDEITDDVRETLRHEDWS